MLLLERGNEYRLPTYDADRLAEERGASCADETRPLARPPYRNVCSKNAKVFSHASAAACGWWLDLSSQKKPWAASS